MSLVLSAGMQETVPLPAPLGLICRTYQAVTAKDKQGACTDGNVLSHLVWAMYGLCMSDAWAVSVAWYERKANKRERERDPIPKANVSVNCPAPPLLPGLMGAVLWYTMLSSTTSFAIHSP